MGPLLVHHRLGLAHEVVPLAFCLGARPLEAPDLGLVPLGSRRCELSSKREVALMSRDLLAIGSTPARSPSCTEGSYASPRVGSSSSRTGVTETMRDLYGSRRSPLDGAAAESQHVRDEDLGLRERPLLPDGRRTLIPGGERLPSVAVELA
jgi:hypothetical protein